MAPEIASSQSSPGDSTSEREHQIEVIPTAHKHDLENFRLCGGHFSPRARLDATANRCQDTDAPRLRRCAELDPGRCFLYNSDCIVSRAAILEKVEIH